MDTKEIPKGSPIDSQWIPSWFPVDPWRIPAGPQWIPSDSQQTPMEPRSTADPFIFPVDPIRSPEDPSRSQKIPSRSLTVGAACGSSQGGRGCSGAGSNPGGKKEKLEQWKPSRIPQELLFFGCFPLSSPFLPWKSQISTEFRQIQSWLLLLQNKILN